MLHTREEEDISEENEQQEAVTEQGNETETQRLVSKGDFQSNQNNTSPLLSISIGCFLILLGSLVLGVLFGIGGHWGRSAHVPWSNHSDTRTPNTESDDGKKPGKYRIKITTCHPKLAKFPVYSLRSGISLGDVVPENSEFFSSAIFGNIKELNVVAFDENENATHRFPGNFTGVHEHADWRYDILSNTEKRREMAVPFPMPLSGTYSSWSASVCSAGECDLGLRKFYAGTIMFYMTEATHASLRRVERTSLSSMASQTCETLSTPKIYPVDKTKEPENQSKCTRGVAAFQLEALLKNEFTKAFAGPCKLTLLQPIDSIVISTKTLGGLTKSTSPNSTRHKAESVAQLDISTANKAVKELMCQGGKPSSGICGGSIHKQKLWGQKDWLYEPRVIHSSEALLIPQLGMDEEYSIGFDSSLQGTSSLYMNATALWGISRAFATIAQLSRITDGVLDFHDAEIIDAPRFPWRGFSIDTSRHFIPVRKILDIIDAMAMSKLNTLHWHMVDSQSFPLLLDLSLNVTEQEYKIFADWTEYFILSTYGTISCHFHGDTIPNSSFYSFSSQRKSSDVELTGNFTSPWSRAKVYGRNSIDHIVRYAAFRGIRVVPEIDIPAHAGGWGCAFSRWVVEAVLRKEKNENPAKFLALTMGNSLEEVLRKVDGTSCPSRCYPPMVSVLAPCHAVVTEDSLLHGIDKYALDPSLRITYDVVGEVLQKIQYLFPDAWLHLGGDEVDESCWYNVEHIRQWAVENRNALRIPKGDLTKETLRRALWFKFTNTVLQGVQKKIIVWQDTYDELGEPTKTNDIHLPANVAIQTWKCWSGVDTNAAVKAADSWELQRRGVIRSSCWYLDWGSSWSHMYSLDPWPDFQGRSLFPSSPLLVNSPAVWGGEAAVWTEHIDLANVGCKSFPRAAAVAERLWSSRLKLSNSSITYTCLESNCKAKTRYGVNRTMLMSDKESARERLSFFRDRMNMQTSITPSRLAAKGSKKMSSLCPSISQDVQWAIRPKDTVNYSDISNVVESMSYRYYNPSFEDGLRRFHTVISFNVAEGGQASFGGKGFERPESDCKVPGNSERSVLPPRLCEILHWIRSREADVVALVELNGWDIGEEDIQHDLFVSRYMQENAAFAGYPYSVLLRESEGFHLGIMSREPLRVLSYDNKRFERGMIVVEIEDIIYIVVHLHAHDSEARVGESKIVRDLVAELTVNGRPVLVVGDMNTVSPRDIDWHKKENLLSWLRFEAPPRLLRKHGYTLPSQIEFPSYWNRAFSTKDVSEIATMYPSGYDHQLEANYTVLDYRPMDILLERLEDLCFLKRWPEEAASNPVEKYAPSPCDYTEPTHHSLVEGVPAKDVPPFRLDYGLGNSILTKSFSSVACTVVQTEVTSELSDHYPVECRWKYSV